MSGSIRIQINDPNRQAVRTIDGDPASRIAIQDQQRTAVRSVGITGGGAGGSGSVDVIDTLDSTDTNGAASANMANALHNITLAIRSGTVNSVAISTGTGLTTQSGSPVTNSGTITITANDASTTVNGVVRLNDTLTSSNIDQAATANAVRTVNALVETVNAAVQSVRSGTVNSVSISTGTGLTQSGSPITETGTISIAANAASTSVNGVVRLNDTLESQNTFQAATARSANALHEIALGIRSGTVNSVAITAGSGLVQSGSPITDSGSITLSANDASVTTNGIVRLNDTITSSNTGQAATANAVRTINVLVESVNTLVQGVRSGTVNSVAISAGNGLQQSGSPITDSGTVTISANDASVTTNGVVRLNDTLTSSNVGQAATANTVRTLNTLVGTIRSGTVNSVSIIAGGGLTQSGSPVTETGAITVSANDASLTSNGIVRLNDTVNSQNTGQAATANSVNAAKLIFTTDRSGQVPTSPGGTSAFLRADGSWEAPTGGSATPVDDTLSSTATANALSANMGNVLNETIITNRAEYLGIEAGTVNSVSIIAGQGISQSGSPVTDSGSITITANDASLTVNGVVRLNDTLSSTNIGQALTANQGRNLSLTTQAIRSGTVNSVSIIAGQGLVQSGSPVTDSGSITVTANDASLTVNGIVRLNDTVISQNIGQAATANAVNAAKLIFSTARSGQVPTSPGGTSAFLRADGSWAAPTGGSATPVDDTLDSTATANALSANMGNTLNELILATAAIATGIEAGTVNSVSIIAGQGLIQSGSPITDTGSITITANDASLTVNGIVRLNDTLTSTNIGQALTANQGKNIWDAAQIIRSGTVNSVSITAGSGLVQSGSPVTGTGSITITANDASVSVNGVVRLNDTVTSQNIGQAATANSVNTAVRIFTDALSGQVPASGGGTTNFLRADGTFAEPPGGSSVTVDDVLTSTQTANALSANMGNTLHQLVLATAAVAEGIEAGTVNSVSIIAGQGLIQSGSPITGTGSITVTANDASLTVNGVVRLNDTLTSTNIGQALTANQGKNLWDSAQLIRSGTVNSVTIVAGSGLVQSGSPVTGTGSITVTANDASISVNGVVRLNDTLTSTNIGQALTANQGRNLSLTTQAIRSGVVNSVSIIAGQGLVQSGSPVTDSGSITVTANDASLTVNGIVRLNDTLTSTNIGQALTANQGRNLSLTDAAIRSGTVNSVSIIAGSGLIQSGSPVTDSGSITVTANDASITVNGVVRLNDTVISQNIGQAATANAVNAAKLIFSSARSGQVPTSPGGTSDFLRADGTWATPPGAGGTSNLVIDDLISAGDTSNALAANQGNALNNKIESLRPASLTIVIDNGANTLNTGIAGDLEVPFGCIITRATMLAGNTGNLQIDVWKAPYDQFPPTSANLITASAPPTITLGNKSQDSTLTGWETGVAAGDILRFFVNTVVSINTVTLSLLVSKNT